MRRHLTIATRGSRLALWQAEHVRQALLALHPALEIDLSVIKTKGDIILDVPLAKVGGKGLFVKEIEEALLSGAADLAVHSVKDVPMVLPEGLLLGCVPRRESPNDVFLSVNYASLADLPTGAKVGTSSLRRQAQLLMLRPDLSVGSLRGNVDTRLRKLLAGEFDAIVLAHAGLTRLGLSAPKEAVFSVDTLVPAVGQGALGIECREEDGEVLMLLADLEDRATRLTVTAERALLQELDGGCQVPIAGHSRLLGEEELELTGLVADVDGSTSVRGVRRGHTADAWELGRDLALELRARGGADILARVYGASQGLSAEAR